MLILQPLNDTVGRQSALRGIESGLNLPYHEISNTPELSCKGNIYNIGSQSLQEGSKEIIQNTGILHLINFTHSCILN